MVVGRWFWYLAAITAVLVTVLALQGSGRTSGSDQVTAPELIAAPPPVLAPTSTPTPTPSPVESTASAEPPPTPTPLPLRGEGSFVYATADDVRYGSSPYRTFSVAVEGGIDLDADDVAAFVDQTLADDRSWVGDTVTGFERLPEGGEWTLVIASPDTVDDLCHPLQTAGELSCATNGWIAVNVNRWLLATPEWNASIEEYRRYVINHETGHYFHGPNHEDCPADGAVAPIMMQQTTGLDGCEPNGWVYPSGRPLADETPTTPAPVPTTTPEPTPAPT